jgi:mannose-6-phosphate isomerase
MLYPFKFDNIYQVMPWAGRELALFRHNLPDGIVGESWDIACHQEGTNAVTNGAHSGKTLAELISILGKRMLGSRLPEQTFPIMVRLICSNEKTSVQVHPTNDFARARGIPVGKTEAWYVMEAFNDTFVYIGARDCTAEQFRNAVHDGSVEKYLNKLNVKKGDLLYIPSGQVHALGPGLLVVEIGQNANTTYRLFDYNRGRRLDIDDAMGVIDLSIPPRFSTSIDIQKDGYSENILCISEFFACVRYEIRTICHECSDPERFHTLTCVEGHGLLEYDGGYEFFHCGESVLIPACLGEYSLKGKLKLLKAYVPNLDFEQDRILRTVRCSNK